jgi:phosphoglycerate dehydrogenase-like enzyme
MQMSWSLTPQGLLSVVEHIFSLLFALIYHFEAFDITESREWAEGQITAGELRNKRLGVVRICTTGSKIATIA